MKRFRFALAAVAALIPVFLMAPSAEARTFARIDTDLGAILVTFDREHAPHHVDNFLHLARTGFYDSTTFHRVIPGFMIQGGDPNSRDTDRSDDGRGFPLWRDVLDGPEAELLARANEVLAAKGYVGMGDEARLKAEFSSVRHVRGTLSMARAQDPDSAGSQFFICVAQAPALDGKYTAFGHVVRGIDVVDAIVSVPRDSRDNPLDRVNLLGVTILEGVDRLTEAERQAWEKEQAGTSIRR